MCSPEPRYPVKRYDPRKTTVPYPGAHTGAPLHMDHTQHPFIPHYIKPKRDHKIHFKRVQKRHGKPPSLTRDLITNH